MTQTPTNFNSQFNRLLKRKKNKSKEREREKKIKKILLNATTYIFVLKKKKITHKQEKIMKITAKNKKKKNEKSRIGHGKIKSVKCRDFSKNYDFR